MCRDGWCERRAFQLLSDLLEAVGAGERPRLALCANLAETFEAPAALYVCLDIESRQLTVTGWPGPDEAPSLTVVVEHLVQAFPSLFAQIARDNAPRCVSLDADALRWRGSIADLLMWELGRYSDVAQLPLNVAGSELRLVALVRRRRFSVRDMHLLGTLHGPLAALDHLFDAAGHDRHDVHAAGADGVRHERDDGVAGHHLTPREVEALSLLAEGLLARSIAARMRVSPRTVHKHLGNVYRKLEAHDRLLAVARAQSLGLIPAQRAPSGPL